MTAAVTAVDVAPLLTPALAGFVSPTLVHRGQPEWAAGVAVAAFYFSGSAGATLAGRRLDAVGPALVAAWSGVAAAVFLLVGAAGGDMWPILVFACAASGAVYGTTVPSTNSVLNALVPPQRLVTMLCVKQASIPVALMIASSVGAFGARLSWRFPFAGAAVVGLIATACFRAILPIDRRRDRADADSSRSPENQREGRPTRGLIALGFITLSASLLLGSLTGYAYTALLGSGVSARASVTVLTVANLLGVVMRLLSGVGVQRAPAWMDISIATLMMVGGLGALLVGTGLAWATVLGLGLAFSFGWGWSGLMFASAIQRLPLYPSRAGSVIQSGGMFGSATGPLLLALTVHAESALLGWSFVGAMAALGGATLFWMSRPNLRPAAGEVVAD